MSETGKHPISEVMGLTMQKVKEMIDANTIVGEPIRADGVTLVPVSKISVGFGSGGSDFGKKKQHLPVALSNLPGGGGGAGITITPVVFLVISDGNVRVLSVDSAPQSPAERILESLPQLIDKAESFLASRTPKKEEELTEE